MPPSVPANPPPPDISSGKPSEPVSAGASASKKCMDCLLERSFSHFGSSRLKPDGFNASCRDCINQASRLRQTKKYGRVNPALSEDAHIRNNRHHNKALLQAFFSGTDYELNGFALCIPDKLYFNYVLRRIPNTSLVEIRIQSNGQDVMFHGCDRLKSNAIEDLVSVLYAYRLEPTYEAMHMAKLYIYDRA